MTQTEPMRVDHGPSGVDFARPSADRTTLDFSETPKVTLQEFLARYNAPGFRYRVLDVEHWQDPVTGQWCEHLRTVEVWKE